MSFHHKVARAITGRHIRQREDGTWIIPASKEVLQEAGLFEIDEYIRRRREYLRRYVEETGLLDRYRFAPPCYTSNKQVVWWNLDHQDREARDTLSLSGEQVGIASGEVSD